MSLRPLAFTFIATLFLAIPSFAQSVTGAKEPSDSSQEKTIEVKTDRFTGKTTVTLKPQVLLDTPEHKLTLNVHNNDAILGLRFDSASKDLIIFGDLELWFIVDGKRIRIGPAIVSTELPDMTKMDAQGRVTYSQLISALSLQQADEIFAGRKVEMRLGTGAQLEFPQQALANMREYTRTLRQAIGKKP